MAPGALSCRDCTREAERAQRGKDLRKESGLAPTFRKLKFSHLFAVTLGRSTVRISRRDDELGVRDRPVSTINSLVSSVPVFDSTHKPGAHRCGAPSTSRQRACALGPDIRKAPRAATGYVRRETRIGRQSVGRCCHFT